MKYMYTCRVCDSSDVLHQDAVLMPFVTYRTMGMRPTKVEKLYDMENGTNYFPCLTLGCRTCGFIGCNVVFDEEELGRLYKNYMMDEYLADRLLFEKTPRGHGQRPDVDSVSKWILQHIGDVPHRIIDYGAVDDARTPFRTTAEIYFSDIQNKVRDTPKSELLTCLHMLEHTCNISASVDDICTYPFEYAYFEVPHERHLQQYTTFEDQVRNKQFWHEHVNFYSGESFKRVLERRFEIVAFEVSPSVIQAVCKLKKPVVHSQE